MNNNDDIDEYNQQNTSKMIEPVKKNSIDDDMFSMTSYKSVRRSPLRFLGNLVDDKLFKKRWSSAKRAKSTDEITWALANEESMSQMQSKKDDKRIRKKSLGIMGTSSNDDKPTGKNFGDMVYKKFFEDPPYVNKKDRSKTVDFKNRKSSNTSSDLLSVSGSSMASLNVGPYGEGRSIMQPIKQVPDDDVRAETLAEIEVT